MFTIYGGKTEFSQYDLDQKVTNPNMCDCEQVVFVMSNGDSDVSRAYEFEGQMVADVPNELLSRNGRMMVCLGQGKNRKIDETTYFDVIKANRPDGYVCTDNRSLKKKYLETTEQTLTEAEKAQVRKNIGVGEGGKGGGVSSWNDLTDKPFDSSEAFAPLVFFHESFGDQQASKNCLDYSIGYDIGQFLGESKNFYKVKTEIEDLTVLEGATLLEGLEYSNRSYGATVEKMEIDGVPEDVQIYDVSYWIINELPDGTAEDYCIFDVVLVNLPYEFLGVPQGVYGGLYACANRGVYTIRKERITRLDEKYMPVLTSENGTKYRVIVTNNGSLSTIRMDG